MINITPINKLDTIEAILERHKGNGGGEPPMEARIAKLEVAIEYIQRDIGEIKADIKEIKSEFKTVYGVVITANLGLAAIMAKGFGWL